MEKLLKMKIFKEDMHVQVYYQWQIEEKTLIQVSSL